MFETIVPTFRRSEQRRYRGQYGQRVWRTFRVGVRTAAAKEQVVDHKGRP